MVGVFDGMVVGVGEVVRIAVGSGSVGEAVRVADGSGGVVDGVIVGKEKSSGVGNPTGVPVGVTL